MIRLVPRSKATIGELTLYVYGVNKASLHAYHEAQEQGFYIEKAGQPTARAELTIAERSDVKAYISEHHPEHARL